MTLTSSLSIRFAPVVFTALSALAGCSSENSGNPSPGPDPGDAGLLDASKSDADPGQPGPKAPAVSIDSSFAAGSGITDATHRIYAAAPGPNGATYVALRKAGGSIGWGNGTLLRRYLADGTLDVSFATQGELPTTLVANPAALATDSEGRILVGGSGFPDSTTTDTGKEIVVVRVTPAGAVDTTYGTGGRTKLNFSAANTWSSALHVRSDHGALLAVYGRTNGKDSFGTFLIGATGAAVTGFGTSGFLGSTSSTEYGLTIGGDALVPTSTQLERFGADGKSKGAAIPTRVSGAKAGKDGSLTAVVTDGKASKLARFSADGKEDASFVAVPLAAGYRDFVVLDGGAVFYSDSEGLSWVPPKGGSSTNVVKSNALSRLKLTPEGKLLVGATNYTKIVRYVF
ncbi:hypothetical protein [Pendulispora albinea]|uniref:Uncharacterized protein n=1 Tax=Pendulispora albinea TaxID=2741071 RepID=A0ABZ2LRG9_9BACT